MKEKLQKLVNDLKAAGYKSVVTAAGRRKDQIDILCRPGDALRGADNNFPAVQVLKDSGLRADLRCFDANFLILRDLHDPAAKKKPAPPKPPVGKQAPQPKPKKG